MLLTGTIVRKQKLFVNFQNDNIIITVYDVFVDMEREMRTTNVNMDT